LIQSASECNRAEFWVADESGQHFNFSPELLGGGTVRMVMVVEDPDAAFGSVVEDRVRHSCLTSINFVQKLFYTA
jgi:hypothetical protein